MKTLLLLPIFLLSLTISAVGQDQWDSSIPETLFLGRTTDDYLNTVKGSMYMFEDFQEGKLKFLKGDYSGPVLINVNAYKRELNLKKTAAELPIALDLNFISDIWIGGSEGEKHFKKLSKNDFSKAKSDDFIYEVLFESDDLIMIKEEVILLNKAETGAYASGPQEDQFVNSSAFYLSNSDGIYEPSNLSKSSIQKILGKDITSKLDTIFKSEKMNWKSEEDVVKALSLLNN